MPVHHTSKALVRTKQKSFKCMSEEDTSISGEYDTESGKILRVKLLRCFDKPYCKTDKEITEFFKGKFLLTLSN